MAQINGDNDVVEEVKASGHWKFLAQENEDTISIMIEDKFKLQKEKNDLNEFIEMLQDKLNVKKQEIKQLKNVAKNEKF